MHQLAHTIRTWQPATFSFVMASSALSIALHLVGYAFLSELLWAIAALALLVISCLFVIRLIIGWQSVRTQFTDPTTAFGFLTIPSAFAVLGSRFAFAGMWTWAFALWVCATVVWLPLSYAVPWSAIAHTHGFFGTTTPTFTQETSAGNHLLTKVNGSWFLWTTAAGTVAMLSALVAGRFSGLTQEALVIVALIGWASGLALYAISAGLLSVRILRYGIPPKDLGPSFWVVMGSLATSGLAGGEIALLAQRSNLAASVHDVAANISVALWGIAAWLTVGLILLSAWRLCVRRIPVSYSVELWSLVFPIATFASMCVRVGVVTSSDPLHTLGHACTWVALAVWTIVVIDGIIRRLIKTPRAD